MVNHIWGSDNAMHAFGWALLCNTALALVCAGAGTGIVYLCGRSGLWGIFLICFGILAGIGLVYCAVAAFAMTGWGGGARWGEIIGVFSV